MNECGDGQQPWQQSVCNLTQSVCACESVWEYMSQNDGLWKYMIVNGSKWVYMKAYEAILRNMNVYESVWMYMREDDGIWKYMMVYKCEW